MSIIRIKAEVHAEVDTSDYPIPADGRLTLQLQEDIQDAIESNLAVSVNVVRVTKTGGKNAEVRNNN